MKQAIDGQRLNAFGVDPYSLIIIGRDTKDGPEHPLYDSRCHEDADPELVKRIKSRGFRSVIQVTKDGERVLVVAGRRRVIAAREALRQLRAEFMEHCVGSGGSLDHASKEADKIDLRVKCIVERGASDTQLFDLMVGENEFRKNYSPLQRADMMHRSENMGLTVEEIADQFGCSEQTVHNYLALVGLHTYIRTAVEAGKISASAAAELAKLPKAEQPSALDEALGYAGETTQREVKAQVRVRRGQSSGLVPSKSEIKRLVHGDGITMPVALHPEFVRALQWVLGEQEIPELRETQQAAE